MKKIIALLVPTILASAASFAVNCKRTVSIISAKEMRVEIVVGREEATGIARLAESLPEGAEIKFAKSEGGTFKVTDNNIKFIWMTLPSVEKITIAYIISTEKLKQGDYSINGKFSFLQGTETHDIDIDKTTFSISAGNEVKLENTPSAAASIITSSAVNESPAAVTNAGKVVYSIQVASTQKQLPKNYFSANYNINDHVKIETAQGQFKYVLGEFKDINAASTFRETLIKKGVKDPFVVAFLDNQRISITEAKKLTGK